MSAPSLPPALLLATRLPDAAEVAQDTSRQWMDALDAQQSTIAQELHDGIGATLASVTLLLGNLKTTLASNAAHTLAVERILVQVLKATDMTRNVARGLMPISDTPGALWRALERLAIDTNSLPGVACKFTLRGDWEQLPAATAHHAYRIVQEATTNALRGGGATRLHLMLSQKGMHRSIVVSDNGAGLQPPAKPGDSQQRPLQPIELKDQRQGVGMASMVARSNLIGAHLRFSRVARGGTRLTLRWRDPHVVVHAT